MTDTRPDDESNDLPEQIDEGVSVAHPDTADSDSVDAVALDAEVNAEDGEPLAEGALPDGEVDSTVGDEAVGEEGETHAHVDASVVEEEPAEARDEGFGSGSDQPAVADEPTVTDESADVDEPVAAEDGEGWLFDTPSELKSVQSWELPPDLIRDRPERRRLIPMWVWGAFAAAVGIIGVIVAAVMLFASSSSVTVPDVTGVALGVAESRLAQVGLSIEVEERRFSSEPVDQVLSQSPQANGELRRGDTVLVVVSGGTEEFQMPDVVGEGVALATSTLEGRGLVVRVDPIPSDLPSDTVIASTPSANSPVRTGDVVTLSVATPSGNGDVLKPYSLGGTVFVIDSPAPAEGSPSDIAMEVTRRLRSLLEASGATVILTRSTTATGAIDVAARERIALEASATALVGFDVEAAGAAGRIVGYPVAGQPAVVTSARQLASEATTQLARVAPPAIMEASTSDPVFNRSVVPWLRVRLGSLAARPDTQSFADPRWADSVARAIYVSLGEQFALGTQP